MRDYSIIPLKITEYTPLDDFDEGEAKEHGWPDELIRAALHEIDRRERESIWVDVRGGHSTIQLFPLVKGENVTIYCDPRKQYLDNDMLLIYQGDYDESFILLEYLDEVLGLLKETKRKMEEVIETDESRSSGILIPKVPRLLSLLEEVTDCLEDVMTGKGGWAWEEVVQESRKVIKEMWGEI